MTDVPAPDTAHPSLEHAAPFVRERLAAGRRDPVRISTVRRAWASYGDPDDTRPTTAPSTSTTLEIRRCAGLAPATIDPVLWDARYTWTVAVDPRNGRWIAGPATLETHPIASLPDDTITTNPTADRVTPR